MVFMQLHLTTPLQKPLELLFCEPINQALVRVLNEAQKLLGAKGQCEQPHTEIPNQDAVCRKTIVTLPAKTSMQMGWKHLDKFRAHRNAKLLRVSLTGCVLRFALHCLETSGSAHSAFL